MRKLILILSLTGAIRTAHAQEKPKELLAAVLTASGECYYERDGKSEVAKVKTIFFKNDRVFTKKGKMDIQLGPSAVLHLAPYSTVRIADLMEADKKANIALELESGRGYTKFAKQMPPGSKYQIKTPTIVAGVRGTEFILSAGDTPEDPAAEDADIPAGVFVNHGKVAVASAGRENEEQEIPAGEQVTGVDNQLVKGVMEDFIKKKMRLFKQLNCMREAQYKIMEREKNRQIELLEKVKGSVKIQDAGSAIEEMRKKNEQRFNK
ncbi:MAG: FecR domain-containing protein [Spirochaetes bacterium]|nr:FecR domain-containing protein [Spirochaetota bacterium]MBX3721082.1 FecR domain-containing protein [Turneriella sp.]